MFDNIDKKILEILGKDGRIKIKDLAKDLNISAPAAADRVKRLERKGVITSYKAEIDRYKLGQSVSVFINIDMPASMYDEFREFANNSPEITEFYYVTGQYSLIVQAFLQDTLHLAKFLEKAQYFGTTETFVVMYTNKKNSLF